VAVFARQTTSEGAVSNPSERPTLSVIVAATPTALASDAAWWDAIPAVEPRTSADFPGISSAARNDPTAYARAFARELFTRDYATDRADLLAWAQYENSPLRAPNYPQDDWTKFLVNALTDLTWDAAIDTPVPAEGVWLALRVQHARQTVTDLRVSMDPTWERLVARGYQPPDPLATARDVTATVVRQTEVAGHTVRETFAVSIALQLGTSPLGGYGVAVTNNYVVKEVN
jgi:hypothetical protein